LVWLPYIMLAFSVVLRPTMTTSVMEASWQTYISIRSPMTTMIKEINEWLIEILSSRDYRIRQ
jgi:hypothetical protein